MAELIAAGPEPLDQQVARDRLVGAEEQDRKQGTRLAPTQRDGAALGHHLERAEETELHVPIVFEPRVPHKDAASSSAAAPRVRTPRLDRRSTGPAHTRGLEERHPREELA